MSAPPKNEGLASAETRPSSSNFTGRDERGTTKTAGETQAQSDLSAYAMMDLPQLSGAIQWEQHKVLKCIETAVSHAATCGEMLIEAKKRVPHGAWTKWIEDNTDLSHRTVSDYMTLGANSQRAANLGSIREALKLIAGEKAEERTRIHSETYVPFLGEELVAVKAEPSKAAPRQPPAIILEAEIVEPAPEPQDDEHEVVVVDGTREAAPAPKDENEFISIRVSDLKQFIADIDKGFALIRFQESNIEEAVDAGKVKFTGNGEAIMAE